MQMESSHLKENLFYFLLFIKSSYIFVASLVASLVALVVDNPPLNAGDAGSIHWMGRSPGGGPGNPLWYSCLESPIDRGA